MNELAIRQENALAISADTKELIQAGVSENTLRAYRRALDSLAGWLTTKLNDAVLAEYITELHRSGKSPSTISQVVAAVKWQAKNLNRDDVVGAITLRTLAGIRREGKERGRGQVDGLMWKDMERVCSFAEASVEGFISGHSLRVGSAVSLARAGVSVVDMQTAGRWKSADMPAHYAKAELAERGALPPLRKRERLPETGRQTYWAMALQGLSCQLQRSARDGTSRNEDTAPEVVCGSNDYH